MKKIFLIVLFMVFFNISAFLVASVGIFPNTLYGDAFYNIEDTETLPTEQEMFGRLLENTYTERYELLGISLGFWEIMSALAVASIAIAIATKSTAPIAIALVGVMFGVMYMNSRSLFDQITGGLDGSVQYLVLMVGVGILILFVITAMDYAAGQSSG